MTYLKKKRFVQRKICPNCKFLNDFEANVCANCGYSFDKNDKKVNK